MAPTSSVPAFRPQLSASVRRHALAWLVAANLIGVLLAAELLWPALGDSLAPYTYGRWMPLHLNWQLYGWCALPLVGALLAGCLEPRHPSARIHARVALAAWSAALALGGISWLQGVTSGKLFLDWAGWARPLLPLAMTVLWTLLAAHAVWGWKSRPKPLRAIQVVLLAGLLPVPALLYWAAGREVYPSVNPDSGGATGASLLGSTLGIVSIFGLLPHLLGVALRPGRRERFYWFALAGSFAVYGLIDHGHASHRAPAQVLGLGLLILWIPLLFRWLGAFAWSEPVRPWLRAALAWWLVLVVTGWLTFLPGLSERLKFTNGLVAHAHIAMAGLVTAIHFLILNELDPARPLRRGFALWQISLAVQAAALIVLGWQEIDRPGALFRSEAWTQALYGVRLVAGAAMAAVSIGWLREAFAGAGLRKPAVG